MEQLCAVPFSGWWQWQWRLRRAIECAGGRHARAQHVRVRGAAGRGGDVHAGFQHGRRMIVRHKHSHPAFKARGPGALREGYAAALRRCAHARQRLPAEAGSSKAVEIGSIATGRYEWCSWKQRGCDAKRRKQGAKCLKHNFFLICHASQAATPPVVDLFCDSLAMPLKEVRDAPDAHRRHRRRDRAIFRLMCSVLTVWPTLCAAAATLSLPRITQQAPMSHGAT